MAQEEGPMAQEEGPMAQEERLLAQEEGTHRCKSHRSHSFVGPVFSPSHYKDPLGKPAKQKNSYGSESEKRQRVFCCLWSNQWVLTVQS